MIVSDECFLYVVDKNGKNFFDELKTYLSVSFFARHSQHKVGLVLGTIGFQTPTHRLDHSSDHRCLLQLFEL